MDTQERLTKTLDAICGHIPERIRRINYGGCGVFALELAKAIRKYYKGEPFNIRIWSHADEPPVDVEEVEGNLKSDLGFIPDDIDPWNANGVYFNHIRLEYNGVFWDAVEGAVPWDEGEYYEEDYVLLDGGISMTALAKLVKVSDNWNTAFDRNQIPTIREIIQQEFEKHLTA